MDIYLETQTRTVDAVQYNGQQHELVKRIRYDYVGNVMVDPRDWYDAFFAVNTYNGWKKVNKTDWIVKKGQKILVIKDEVFQLLYDVP